MEVRARTSKGQSSRRTRVYPPDDELIRPTSRRSTSSQRNFHQEFQPTPPERPPSSRSSTYRRRSSKQHAGNVLNQAMGDSSSSRPSTASSLNRYTPLPSINADKNHIEYPNQHSEPRDRQSGHAHDPLPESNNMRMTSVTESEIDSIENEAREKILSCSRTKEAMCSPARDPTSFSKLTRTIVLPSEPSANTGASDVISLAIKLPDGSRCSRRFNTQNKLSAVLHFAELSSTLDFSDCILVDTATIPRVEYTDLSVTIATANIPDRTLLHVFVPDEPTPYKENEKSCVSKRR